MYREHLLSLSTKLQAKLGTTLFDSSHATHEHKPEADFFAESLGSHAAHVSTGHAVLPQPTHVPETTVTKAEATQSAPEHATSAELFLAAKASEHAEEEEELSTSDLASMSLAGGSKSSAAKKPIKKKAGLGAKKVVQNFDQIEQQANSNTKAAEPSAAPAASTSSISAASFLAALPTPPVASAKLPAAKAEQAERLGMGMGGNRPLISHSSSQGMKTIDQIGK
jgi:hypothetical protein